MYLLRSFPIFCLLLLSLATNAQTGIIALKGGTIIDVDKFGASTRDIKNAVVLVRDKKIIAAGPAGKIAVPAGAKVIDVSGKFIVPGLIEGFGSVANQAFANAYLYMGVTTVSTVEDNRRGKTFWTANPSPSLYKQDAYWGSDRVESKKPGQLFENINYRNYAQINHEIDSMAKEGAKSMLIHYGVKKEQLPAVVAACKRNKLAMVGELGFSSYEDAVKAGVKSFVHTSRYTADVMPDSVRAVYGNAPFGPPASYYYEYIAGRDIIRDSRLQQLGDLYSRNTVALMPTGSLLVYTYSSFARNPWNEPIAAIIDEKDILHEPLDRQTGKPKNPPPPHRAKVAPILLRIDSFFVKKGAHYLTGSGATAFGTLPGISLHTELQVLSHAGLNNRQVLAAATNNFSLIWDWTHIGKIEAGRDADILVLSADPLQSIENLKKIDLLFVQGKIIDRNALMKTGK
jgi:hypothetical protein